VVGTFTDAEARPDALGRECREYTFTAQIAGSQQEIYGIACREPDGSWHEASESFEPEREAPAPQRYSRQASEQGYAPYPYAGWDRGYWYPSVGLSASYCFSGVCFGSGYSTGYSGYGYPYDNYGYRNHYRNYYSNYSNFGFSFGNRHYGHKRHHKKHHGRKHHRKRHGRHH